LEELTGDIPTPRGEEIEQSSTSKAASNTGKQFLYKYSKKRNFLLILRLYIEFLELLCRFMLEKRGSQ
jgi:hypothetical protein